MEYSINIDQITLEEWEGKIDMIDCAIITFIRDLNPDNPKIKKLMWRGYFLVKLEWLLDELPMLGIADRTTRRRLQHMCELGILEKLNKRIDGEGIRQLAYYKLSKAFWKAHAKRHKKVEDGIGHEPKKDAEDVHSGDENPRGQIVHLPRSKWPGITLLVIKRLLRRETPPWTALPSEKGKEKKISPPPCANAVSRSPGPPLMAA